MNSSKSDTQIDPLASLNNRITSLDQFRGYTVVGMLLVNFLGSYAACPKILRHSHDYISYADTIMPQFLFAVGFAFRLTFGRRALLHGTSSAYWRVVRRMLGLVLVSLVVYAAGPRAPDWAKLSELGFFGAIAEPLKRTWFQTLMHIAATGLWLLPVIRSGVLVRVSWMMFSAIVHIGLSYWFNFNWTNGVPQGPNGIDGGPLGFLTWVIPAGVGTLACDAVVGAHGGPKLWMLSKSLFWAALLMGLGYAISCGTRFYDVPADQVESLKGQKIASDPVWPTSEQIERKRASGDWSEMLAEPPFVPPPDAQLRKWNYWMMSQRAGTLSYLTFSAGFSLAVYVLFYIACDLGKLRLAFFETFGTNALLAYIVHDMVGGAVKPFLTKDAPGWTWIPIDFLPSWCWIIPGWSATAGLLLFFLISWTFVRTFEKQGVYLKV